MIKFIGTKVLVLYLSHYCCRFGTFEAHIGILKNVKKKSTFHVKHADSRSKFMSNNQCGKLKGIEEKRMNNNEAKLISVECRLWIEEKSPVIQMKIGQSSDRIAKDSGISSTYFSQCEMQI